jgi:hypothetical protein
MDPLLLSLTIVASVLYGLTFGLCRAARTGDQQLENEPTAKRLSDLTKPDAEVFASHRRSRRATTARRARRRPQSPFHATGHTEDGR